MERITKIYEVKAPDLQENRFRGVANVMGILDRGYDVTFPGFFKKACAKFVQEGFVAIGHEWEGLPVAYPLKAAEKGNLLEVESEFHSTQKAQDARTICQERIAAGKSVGLSVGFMPDYAKCVKWYESGAELLADAEEMGCDLSLFDTAGIRAHKGYCRGLLPGGCKELYEYSIVTVPMNQQSTVTEAKAGDAPKIYTRRDAERLLRDAGVSRTNTKRVLHEADQWDADAPQETVPDSQVLAIKCAILRQRAELISAGVAFHD